MLHDIIKTIQQRLADGVDTIAVGVDTLRRGLPSPPPGTNSMLLSFSAGLTAKSTPITVSTVAAERWRESIMTLEAYGNMVGPERAALETTEKGRLSSDRRGGRG